MSWVSVDGHGCKYKHRESYKIDVFVWHFIAGVQKLCTRT